MEGSIKSRDIKGHGAGKQRTKCVGKEREEELKKSKGKVGTGLRGERRIREK